MLEVARESRMFGRQRKYFFLQRNFTPMVEGSMSRTVGYIEKGRRALERQHG
jgi:hypothetical protein